jgi:GH24 family phage-related lysozyme (muramidase)
MGQDALMPRLMRIEYPGAIDQLRRGENQGGPHKLALAARRRREATLTIAQIAERLRMGSRKSAAPKLHAWRKDNE